MTSITVIGMADHSTSRQVFQMRVDDALLAALDDLRRFEPDLPDRTEMVKRLILRAAAADRQQPKRKK